MSLMLSGYIFRGPEPLKRFVDDDDHGLFGIFYLKNPEKQVANYGLVYIGGSEELEEQGFPETHKKYEDWIKVATTKENLYYGVCPTPGLTPQKVDAMKNHLIYKYNPPANR